MKTPIKKVAVPVSKLQERFLEQLGFLRKSSREFDAGDFSESQRLALAVRVLLHTTKTSKGLIDQLSLQDTLFLSSGLPIDDANLLTQFSLAYVDVRHGSGRLDPILDTAPWPKRWLKFEDWWHERVLRDTHKHDFTRRDIVLSIADKDGGAHVDERLDEPYHRLVNEHSISTFFISKGVEQKFGNVEKVFARQIAWEVVVTLDAVAARIAGNQPCACGSGRKARYCCAKKNKIEESSS